MDGFHTRISRREWEEGSDSDEQYPEEDESDDEIDDEENNEWIDKICKINIF
jgi:hypothetical protein